jgi:hypothetical protein
MGQEEWDHDGVLLKALWIAIGLGTDQGCRPSNLVQKDGKKAKDHTLRNSRRVTFLLRGGGVATAGMKGMDVVGVNVKLSSAGLGRTWRRTWWSGRPIFNNWAEI